MRVQIGLAILAALTLSTPTRAAVVEEFKAADWDGLAFTSDETGLFTHCSIYATYRNGSTLYISYEVSEAWFFSIANDSWSLAEGGSFAIKFKVDRRGQIEGTGTALGPTQIGLPVEADHAFVGQLRRGNQLVVSFQNKDYAFELSNSNKAMNAAQDCVRRHVRLGTRTPIITQKPDSPPPQESQQAEQQPAPQPPPSPPAAEPEPDAGQADSVASGDQQQIGPWVVTAASDATGNFANCTAYGVHGDDQLILSYFPDEVWTFGLYRSAWQLDTNQTYYLWYNVDGPADAPGVTKRPVDAPEATRIFFEVSDVEDIIEKIEAGTVLNLQFRGITGPAENYSYPLDQVHEAFEATRKCVADHAGGSTAEATPSKEGTGVDKEETPADITADTGGEGAEADTAEADTAADTTEEARRELPELGTSLIENLEVPGWQAAGFSNDAGTFTHCGIKAEYQNGATLGVARTAGGDLLLAIQHGDWSLDEGSWVPISYALSGEPPLQASGEGQAAAANAIVTVMGNTESLTLALKAAPEITVEAEGKSFSFDITDIGPGITAIDECVARNMAPSVPSQKPAAKKVEATPEPEADVETDTAMATDGDASADIPPPGPDTSPPHQEVALNTSGQSVEMRNEVAGYTTALLFRAGYPNHIILPEGAEVPDSVPPGEAMWELGEVMGSTHIVDSGTPDDIKSAVGSSMLEKCGGITNTDILNSDATHMHFRLKCKASDTNATHFVVIPRDAGGSYLFALVGSADDIAAASIADAVYNKAVGG